MKGINLVCQWYWVSKISAPKKLVTPVWQSWSFSHSTIYQNVEKLRNWFYTALSAGSLAETGNPSNLFSFYERVEKLIEAAHVMKEA